MKTTYDSSAAAPRPALRRPWTPAIVAVGLAMLIGLPATGAAQSIHQSAERLAAEAALQNDGEMRVSPGRVGLGLALAAAGAAMMLVDPKQPTQPGPISDDTLTQASVSVIERLTVLDTIRLRSTSGQPVLRCEPFCIGDIDAAILGSFVTGAAVGVISTTTAMEERGWRLYGGAIQPFKKRSAGLKYGGAALAVAGAAIAAFWSHVPVVDRLAVAPTVGGMQVGTTIGF